MLIVWRNVGIAGLVLMAGCASAQAQPTTETTPSTVRRLVSLATIVTAAPRAVSVATLPVTTTTSSTLPSTATTPVSATTTAIQAEVNAAMLDAEQLEALEAIGWKTDEIVTEVLGEEIAPDPEMPSVQLAQGLYEAMVARLPEPQVRFSQVPTALRSGAEVSFWVLSASSRLSPAERYEGPVGSTLVALAAKATLDPGNGDAPVVCDRVPTRSGQCTFAYPALAPGSEPLEYTATVSVTWTFWYTTTDKINGTFAPSEAFTVVTTKVLSPPAA